METINIYNPDNSLFKAQAVSADCMYRNELQGEECVELKWEGHEYEQIPVGAYIEYDSRRFRLDEPHEPSRRTEDVFTFNPVFYSEPHHWRKAQACYYEYGSSDVQYSDTVADNQHTIALTTLPTPTGVELDWSFTGNLPDAMSMILQAIKNETGATWNARYGSEIATTLIEISAQGLSVFDFISQVAEQCGKEFYFDFSDSTPVVCIGTLEIQAQGTHTEDGRVLLNVGDDVANPSVQSDADEYFTRFYFFGSNRNIVQPNSITKSSVVNRRLPLLPTATTGRHSYPKGFIDINRTPQSYDANGVYQPTLPPYKVYAKSVFFDDIYPHSDLKIKTVQTRHIAVEDDSGAPTGENMPIFYITLKDGSGNDFVFNNDTYDEQHPNGHRLPGLVPSVAFRSGYLQGLEYELYYHDEDFSVSTTGSEGQGGYVTIHAPCFEVIFDTNSNPRLPNDTIKPQVNDECTLFNIKMPNEYILTAQAELEEKALDYIADLNVDKSTYTINSNPVRFDSITALKELRVGTLAKMIYPSGTEVQSRVIKIEKHLDFPCECTVTLGYKATQGTLTTLRETIADTSEKTETVIKSGEKNTAQILGLRNGYRAQKETFDKAFDTDGYFDGSRIKPLTVETNALSVGSRSQQFTLSGVQLSVAKYTTGNGTLSWDCTSGKLVHLSLDEDYILIWPMATGTQALNDANSHYIYAKVAKDGFGAASGGIKTNSNSGKFVATAEQKKFDSDQDHYYFLVGTVSSELTESGSTYKTRVISLTYGTTTINGKQIQTGVIRSSDGSRVVIDLDNGTITGDIRFQSGSQGQQIIENLINNTVDDAVSEIEIGGRNLVPKTAEPTRIPTSGTPSGNYTYVKFPINGQPIKQGDVFTLSANVDTSSLVGNEVTVSFYNDAVSTTYTGWVHLTVNNGRIEGKLTVNASGNNKTDAVLLIYSGKAGTTAGSVVTISNLKLERGTVATDWTPAPEDTEAEIAQVSDETLRTQLTGSSGVRTSTSTTNTYSVTCSQWKAAFYKAGTRIKITFGSNYGNSGKIAILNIGGTTKAVQWLGSTSNKAEWRGGATIEFEYNGSNWFITNEAELITQEMYAQAAAGTTNINGGLILTKMIQCGSGSQQAGISGTNNAVAFWAGGSIGSAQNMNTPVVIFRNGEAKFGLLNISNGKIYFQNSGVERFVIQDDVVGFDSSNKVYNPANANNTGAHNNCGNGSIPVTTITGTESDPTIVTVEDIQALNNATAFTYYPNMPVHINFNATLSCTGISTVGTSAICHIELQLYSGSDWVTLDSSVIEEEFDVTGSVQEESGFKCTYDAKSIPSTTGYKSAIGLRVSAWVYNGTANFSYSSLEWSYYKDISKTKTIIGNNGFGVMRNSTNMFKTVIDANEETLTTTIKGNTDIPGVLWAGKIGTDGSPSKSFSTTGVSLAKASGGSTGLYYITPTGLTNGTFVVMAQPTGQTSSVNYHCLIQAQGTGSAGIKIRCLNGTTLTNMEINLVIYGKN